VLRNSIGSCSPEQIAKFAYRKHGNEVGTRYPGDKMPRYLARLWAQTTDRSWAMRQRSINQPNRRAAVDAGFQKCEFSPGNLMG
jgi:hypothetical protein